MAKKILETPSSLKPAPRRGLPKWLWAIGGVLVLGFLVLLIAPFFIPWAKLKDQAAVAASHSLGRNLKIGAVEVGLFSGVHVKDVSLANAIGDGFSPQPLFSNADAKVSLNFLSLLTGRVVLSSIVFDKPQVLLETNRAGVSNLAGLGSAKAPATGGQPKAEAKASSGGESLPVVLASLVVSNGDIVLRDRQKGTETAVHGLDVKLQGLSLAAAGGSRLEVGLTAEVEGKKIPLAVVSDFKLDLAGESVDIKDFTATLPAVTAKLKGSVKGFAEPKVDLDADVDVALAQLPELLPPSVLKKLPPDLKTSGRLDLAATAQGPLKQPETVALKGALTFDKVDVAYGSYPALGAMTGTLSFDKAGADLPGLAFKLGGDPVTIGLKAHWGDLGNVSGGPGKLKAQVALSVKSPKLNLDPLMAMGGGAKEEPAPGAGKAAAQTQGGGMQDLRGTISKGLDLSVDVDVDAMTVQGLNTGKLTERFRLKDQKAGTATDLDLYQGHFSERTSMDFSQVGPGFHSVVKLAGLQFDKMVDDLAAANPKDSKLAQLKGKVSGKLSLNADAQGRGFSDPARSKNLQATANFQFKDGVIRKTDLQEQLASVIPDPQTQSVLRNDISFSTAQGDVQIAGLKTTLRSFQLGTGSDWRGGALYLQASGTQMKDGPVDFHLTPHFNPSQVHIGGDLGKAFQDAQGWPTYDYISYAGPTQAQAKADFTAGLKKAATKAVTDKVQQVIKDKAGDALKQLPGGLNKLFGQ